MKVRRLLLSLLLLFVSNIIVYETVHLNDKKVIDGINQTLSDTKNRMKGSKIFYYNVSTEYYGFYRVLVLTPSSDTATIRVRMIGNGGGGTYLQEYDRSFKLTYPYSGKNELKIALMSDLHIGSPNADILFKKTIDDMNMLGVSYSFVIGDLVGSGDVQYATEEFFDTYITIRNTSILAREKWVEVAGNHDKDKGGESLSIFLDKLGYESATYTKTFDNITVIAMGCTYGNVNEVKFLSSELNWAEENIQSNQDKNIFLLVHAPKYSTTWKSTESSYYALPKDDMNLLLSNNKIDAYFHGHVHIDESIQFNGIESYE